MMANYFTGRKQRVQIDHIKGKSMDVVKGSPQGSLMGPFTYNVHLNGDELKGDFEPILTSIYKGDRDQFGIKGARFSIYPLGGRKINEFI